MSMWGDVRTEADILTKQKRKQERKNCKKTQKHISIHIVHVSMSGLGR